MSRIHKIKSRLHQKGNALVYFAVILVLGSIAALTVAKYYSPKKTVEQQQILEQKLNNIAQSLSVFVGDRGRLPCPASPNVATGNANFGVESRDATTFECNAAGLIANTNSGNIRYMGGVPSKTLGLADSDVIDPWGNKIEYAVSYAMYKNKTESSANNYYANNGALQIQDAGGNTLESAGAYVLISRGKNQLGAWPATGTSQVQVPTVGSQERLNLGCLQNSASCGGSSFGAIFISSPDSIDDILLYKNKTGVNSKCQGGYTNSSCNNVACSSSSWTVGGLSTFNITQLVLPTLTVPALILAQQGMGYSVKLNLNSLSTTSGAFKLMYTYTTTSSATVQTVEIAEFSSSSFSGRYDSTYVGQTITIPFGASNHIPVSLYFSTTGGSMTGSMSVSNVSVNVAPLYYKNMLDYKIWTGLCGTFVSGCGGGVDTSSGCGGTCGKCLSSTSCVLGDLQSSSSYPNNPSYQSMIPLAQGFTSFGSNYYSMISGYFTPDQTAQYTFYIATNNNAVLYMSPDNNPANAVQVASRTTPSAALAWTATGATTYGPVSLTTGKSYYFHVIHQALTTTPDNLALGCAKTSSSGTTAIDILGTSSDTVGCGGTVSTAPILTVLNQVQCQ